jgi:hypothetical protein
MISIGIVPNRKLSKDAGTQPLKRLDRFLGGLSHVGNNDCTVVVALLLLLHTVVF